MKALIRFILFLLLFLSIPMWGQTATKIVSYWSAGSCSTGCVTGYTLSITPPTGAAISIPLASTITNYTWAPGGKLSFGNYSVTIVTNVSGGATPPPPSIANFVYASGISTGTAPGGFVVHYTQ